MAMIHPEPLDQPFGDEWFIPPSVLLAAAPSGWLLLDMQGRVCMVNQRTLDIFGYDRRDLIGASIEKLVDRKLQDLYLLHGTGHRRGTGLRTAALALSLRGRSKDGSEFPVEVSLSPVWANGKGYILTVIRDVTERLQLEEERNALAVELEKERERQRIGMDLHDGVMQEVYGAALSLEMALEDIDNQPAQARRRIERALEQLHNATLDMRSYVFDLRPREFRGDLATALVDLAREFEQNSQIKTTTVLQDALPPIPPAQATALYHITHEALSNVRKHAHATRVEISARVAGGRLTLQIADDGVGFDSTTDLPQKHRGIRNMISRARAAGAELNLTSQPGRGARVTVNLPLQPSAA
jgi:PAS domain S-box-containing protein